MDWTKLVEWGVAIGVAFGAKREMQAFRTMFQATLDKLAAQSEAHGKDIAELKAQGKQTNEAIAGLASVVANALYDEDVDGEPGPIN